MVFAYDPTPAFIQRGLGNPIPALTEEGLNLMVATKDKLGKLKVGAFGPDANRFDEDKPHPKLLMPQQELETTISDILSDDVVQRIRTERILLRPSLEQRLHQTVREDLLPRWMPDDAVVMYAARVEGRNREEMSAPIKGMHAGHKKRQTPHKEVLTVDQFRRYFKEVIVTDDKLMSEPEKYQPQNVDYILSSVHKIYLAVRGNHDRRGNSGNGHLRVGDWRADDALQVHWRNKSGPETLFKVGTYMTGLEEKLGRPRETILDEAGARLIADAEYQSRESFYEIKSVEVNQHFSRRHRIDWAGALILQALPTEKSDDGETYRELFLHRIPRKFRRFYERVLVVEDRSSIRLNAHPPYYIEMTVPMGTLNSTFGRNVINILTYPSSVFKALYGEHGYDPFAYKVRDEGWRRDHYTEMEWLVILRLAPAFLDENGLTYVRDLAAVRMRDAGLLPKGRTYSFV